MGRVREGTASRGSFIVPRIGEGRGGQGLEGKKRRKTWPPEALVLQGLTNQGCLNLKW